MVWRAKTGSAFVEVCSICALIESFLEVHLEKGYPRVTRFSVAGLHKQQKDSIVRMEQV